MLPGPPPDYIPNFVIGVSSNILNLDTIPVGIAINDSPNNVLPLPILTPVKGHPLSFLERIQDRHPLQR
jgi:hypothetical protein